MESKNGYFYEIIIDGGGKYKKKRVPAPFPYKKGDKVEIKIKPYNNNITKIGIIKDILTKKLKHSQGHKVRLDDGTVGRIIKKLK